MSDKPVSSLDQSFLESVASPHLRDLVVDLADLTLDSITDSELLEKVPVIGTAMKLFGGFAAIRERFFFKKMVRFLQEVYRIPQAEREAYLARLKENPQKAREVAESFLVWLDRLDDEQKAAFLAKVFEAYVRGDIDFERSARFASAIDRAHVPYLWDLRGGVVSTQAKTHLLVLGLMEMRSDMSRVEQARSRDVSPGNIDFVRLDLNEDGRIFRDYILKEVALPTRITERILTPPKKRKRG